MTDLDHDSLKLKAAIEFGSEYTYVITTGGLGKTLRIIAESREDAGIIRQKAPTTWEGLYILVVYPTHILTRDDIPEPPDLYDPRLT
tara:strand:+ start:466 stop:726 length:261 start_codon:yes stop_codon:yes gene_type:complete